MKSGLNVYHIKIPAVLVLAPPQAGRTFGRNQHRILFNLSEKYYAELRLFGKCKQPAASLMLQVVYMFKTFPFKALSI